MPAGSWRTLARARVAAVGRAAWWRVTHDSAFIRATIGVAALARVAAVLSKPLTFSGYSYDEQFFLWGGWSLLKGLVPYRDFLDTKPPVLFLTEAAALGLFGSSSAEQHFRLFFSILAVGSICAVCIALIKRGVGVLLAVATSLLVVSQYFDPRFHDSSLNDVESIGLAYYLYGTALMLVARRRPWLQALGSGFLMFSVLTKEPFLLLAVPTWLVFFLDGDGVLARPLLPYLKASFLGAAIPAAIILAYLAAVGGLHDYLATYPRTRAFADTYAVRLGLFVPGTFWAEQRESLSILNRMMYSVAGLASWLPLFGAGVMASKVRRWPRLLAGLLGICGSAYAITLGHCFWPHYALFGIGGLALFAILCCMELALAANPRTQGALGALVALILFPHLSERYDAAASRAYPPGSPNVSPAAVEYVKEHTAPNDYILATEPGLYFFAQRKSAVTCSSFVDEAISLYPGATDDERLAWLGAQIHKHQPKVVYIYPELVHRMTRHLDTVLYPFLKEEKYVEAQDHTYLRPW